MSNFNCEHCGAACIDSPRGYVTGCEHYPVEGTTMKTATKEKPILFSGAMVKAILAGHKTVTRRVIKPQPIENFVGPEWGEPMLYDRHGEAYPGDPLFALWGDDWHTVCPYKVVMQLWVREAFSAWFRGEHWYGIHRDDRLQVQCSNVFYRATHNFPDDDQKWVPSIFMPRWASRINLEIVSVRAERLQEITEADVAAEGVTCGMAAADFSGYDWKAHFASTWDALNAKRGYSWDSDPWVWRVEFRRVP